MRRTIPVVILTIGMLATLAPVTSAGPGNGPDQSGAVTRLSLPGTQGLFDPSVRLDGADVPLLAVLNFASPADFCTFTFAGPGDLMIVETPSGHSNILLHDDVPVLIFDATGFGTQLEQVFSNLRQAACQGVAAPIATGEARVRNKLQFKANGTFHHVLDATGTVTDGDLVWSLSLHRRAHGADGGPPAPEDIIDSIRLARRG